MAVFLCVAFPVTVFAGGGPDTCRVTALYYIDNVPANGIAVRLYRAGSFEGGPIVWDDAYKGIPVPNTHSPASMQECAKSLMSRIDGPGLEPDYEGALGADGQYAFGSVRKGVYCITGDPVKNGSRIYRAVPSVIIVEGDMDIELKAEAEGIHAGSRPGTTLVSVEKKWDAKKKAIPKSVTAGLLRDGVLVDSVTLDGSNGWSYTWPDLDAGSVWSVKELTVPDGFYAVLTRSGSRFVITNTDTIKAAPQTGLLSVSYMGRIAASAAVLFIAVLTITKKRRSKK